MIRRRLLLSCTVLVSLSLLAGEPPDLDYFLPEGTEYDPKIRPPAAVLGFEVGEWHVRHDQLVSYLRQLAEESERVAIHEYGETYERRPLLLLAISSPENLSRIGEIRENHLAAARNGQVTESAGERPVIVWLGYSVHGNEPSGSNAALLVAYHLAAALGPELDELLANSVILIDACTNPDGLNRFAGWANSHRGKNLVADPSHREHVEGWPSGRTNHYWFDLNRDWLLLTHPESRGRVEAYHRWLPNIVGDFHEMGSEATYFFQPGVPSRQNPRTPAKNLQLTSEIAKYHAQALDRIGSLYYTEEVFDDFYYGKGSTYPDVNGGIGILFEQASSRGHVREGKQGLLSFPFTIKNHFTTSLSTLRAAVGKRAELLAYQLEFTPTALADAKKDPLAAYVFGDAEDPVRTYHLLDILMRHRIDVRRLAQSVEKDGMRFEPGTSYVVVLAQRQYRLIRSLFETTTTFEDYTFYDVSTWTLPLAFAMPHVGLAAAEFKESLAGEKIADLRFPVGKTSDVEKPYAYLIEWAGYYAPRAAYYLLSRGVRVQVATRPFQAQVGGTARSFAIGTLIVATGVQEDAGAELRTLMQEVSKRDGLDVHSVVSGLTPSGIDLGSPRVRSLKQPRPLLLVGTGVSTYEAGEVWHLLDYCFDVQLSLVDVSVFSKVDMRRYTHLILVDGNYSAFEKAARRRIRDWVSEGGVLLATRGGARWAVRRVLQDDGPEEKEAGRGESESPAGEKVATVAAKPTVYAEFDAEVNRKRVSGAIFEVHLDRTHPLGFGYRGSRLAVFRKGTKIMKLDADPFANVARYTEKPLLSGYASAENQKMIAGTAAVIARRLGRGTVICIADNPNFRGYWYGTNKLFLNGLFFGRLIRDTSQGE